MDSGHDDVDNSWSFYSDDSTSNTERHSPQQEPEPTQDGWNQWQFAVFRLCSKVIKDLQEGFSGLNYNLD